MSNLSYLREKKILYDIQQDLNEKTAVTGEAEGAKSDFDGEVGVSKWVERGKEGLESDVQV